MQLKLLPDGNHTLFFKENTYFSPKGHPFQPREGMKVRIGENPRFLVYPPNSVDTFETHENARGGVLDRSSAAITIQRKSPTADTMRLSVLHGSDGAKQEAHAPCRPQLALNDQSEEGFPRLTNVYNTCSSLTSESKIAPPPPGTI